MEADEVSEISQSSLLHILDRLDGSRPIVTETHKIELPG